MTSFLANNTNNGQMNMNNSFELNAENGKIGHINLRIKLYIFL